MMHYAITSFAKYICKMKERNQPTLRMDDATLRALALDTEEAATNRGIQSDNEDNNNGNSAKKQKYGRIPKENNNGGGTKSIIIRSLYWNDPHPPYALYVELLVILNQHV
jgi:hypothetical protein